MRFEKSATLTAADTYTEWTQIFGPFLIELTGVTDSTVTFQRTRDGGSSVLDIENFSSDTFYTAEMPWTTCLFRVGIKAGNYGSDTVLVHLEG